MKTWARWMCVAWLPLALAAGCDSNDIGGDPDPVPDYSPQPGDQNLERAGVELERVEVVKLNTLPSTYYLIIHGTVPTPCHEVRAVVAPPDGNNEIKVEVYSVYDPAEVCVQVVQPFSASVDIPSPPPGRYTVRVNDEFQGTLVY